MPYASAKQRAFVHAKAHDGVKWAQSFASEADAMKQPDAKGLSLKTPSVGQMVGSLLSKRSLSRE